MKSLIAFDLDGTLAESKSPMDKEMARLMRGLLAVAKVAIISGGAWPQFEKQVLPNLADGRRLDNLSLLPTCGTKFYQRRGDDWTLLYSEDFTAAQKKTIVAALDKAFDQSGLRPKTHWGETIEDRGGQITLSALGQDAPLDEKKTWDPKFEKRKRIKAILEPMIPDFQVQLGGATSIDITRPGVDKAYGIRKLKEVLDVPIKNMIFVGDALFPGGNDYPAKEAGALCIHVRDPHETKRVVEAVIACLET
ncbi:MAG TPA: HAD-IIB family hydrolase [Caulobacteraceae bacterium]|nr:HAD-IIB family hydrolase [Caulobacteraceae bacterium]